MADDPIIDELRKHRDEYAKRVNYDLDAMFEDLKKVEEKAKSEGRKCVSLPPKRVGSKEAA